MQSSDNQCLPWQTPRGLKHNSFQTFSGGCIAVNEMQHKMWATFKQVCIKRKFENTCICPSDHSAVLKSWSLGWSKACSMPLVWSVALRIKATGAKNLSWLPQMFPQISPACPGCLDKVAWGRLIKKAAGSNWSTQTVYNEAWSSWEHPWVWVCWQFKCSQQSLKPVCYSRRVFVEHLFTVSLWACNWIWFPSSQSHPPGGNIGV